MKVKRTVLELRSLRALREALEEIRKKIDLPTSDVERIARHWGVRIERVEKGKGGAPTPFYLSGTIHIPVDSWRYFSPSLCKEDQFCVGHELAHFFCEEITGEAFPSHRSTVSNSSYWWFEIYCEAFAIILTGNREFARVYNSSDIEFTGRAASARLNIAIAHIKDRRRRTK